MKSSETHPIDGKIHVDEFVIGGKENMKPGRSNGMNFKQFHHVIHQIKLWLRTT
ncbi:hypothetical protein O2778_10250 [Ancylomarina euxinus]|uniref:hypothetical protein n=1 Tax=Ancylomarina euxinus TaxID=2283627 RepID=UPI0012E17EF8|nr:hypothetical protein [Ancylomarina euxinus]MCZ4695054.1 hypothetical protein [Ancylomarina euxinus]MUP15010.1 hypothetical protein [Ancylomarina euxinus]